MPIFMFLLFFVETFNFKVSQAQQLFRHCLAKCTLKRKGAQDKNWYQWDYGFSCLIFWYLLLIADRWKIFQCEAGFSGVVGELSFSEVFASSNLLCGISLFPSLYSTCNLLLHICTNNWQTAKEKNILSLELISSLVAQAKPETVEKVMSIVKKQLALSDDVALTPASTFSELGADSLDTVILFTQSPIYYNLYCQYTCSNRLLL